MPGESRSLPGRPNLRYLRLEAKRRLVAGEFPTLHDAQTAIAREHGQRSWAALKQLVRDQASPAGGEGGEGDKGDEGQQSHALDQLRWVISRFAGAGQPGWAAPAPDELRLHFDDHFLSVLPPAALVPAISRIAGQLRDGELEILGQTPFQAHARLGGIQYIAVTEAEPPYRLTGLRGLPAGGRVRDPRVAAPAPPRTQGDVPAEVSEIAAQAAAELGLVALALAGGGGDHEEAPWVLARGWADLDRGEILDPGSRFPAPGVTALVTTTAVLRLVADGRIGLDQPANDHLAAVRLADDTITVRELLTHTAGVDDPTEMYADTRPELSDVMGPVIAATGPRGAVQPSNGGIAVLGQLVADVTGMPYPDATAALVLRPLRLDDSSFPARPADRGPRAVTGYNLTLEGMFQPVPARIPVLEAVAGLWSTGADLVRLGLGWASLLPGALAHEALSPQTPEGPGGVRVGLGWLIGAGGRTAAHAGGGLDATALLSVRLRDGQVRVVLTSRMIPVVSINTRLQEDPS
jgi:CubicO group peptidase (beta-lactamase class C family)